MATAALSDVVLPAPGADWLRSLPGGKLPDRGDFKAWGDDESGRQSEWRKSLTESQRLADEFAAVGSSGRGFDALPLAWDSASAKLQTAFDRTRARKASWL